MDRAPGLPTPVLRALDGLEDRVGRLLMISGPANSGKSALLEQLRTHLKLEGARVTELRGSYHDREVPNAALAPLLGATASPAAEAEPTSVDLPIAALGALADDSGRSSRRRGGERRQGTILGVPYAVRTRGGLTADPAEYWQGLRTEFEDPATAPLAVLVEDGALLDPESRDFLLYVSERVRYRPVLLAVVLDSGVPGSAGWEERLLGRNDVDWVRLSTPRSDPREAHRIKQAFDGLPPASQRILVFTSLLGGSATEVTLSRVTRLTFNQLGDALFPASEARLVRVDGGKVSIPHAEWTGLFQGLLPNSAIRAMHKEIAEAMEAMSPEPTLVRRAELAGHYFRWEPGPTALRFLLETAELTERLSAYDSVLSLVDEALQCVDGLPIEQRASAEVELRLFRTRALFFAGCPAEAERELHAALTLALDHHLPATPLDEWVEALVPALIAVGPRPVLLTEMGELADRAHEGGFTTVEVLFQAILAGHEQRRGRPDRARGGSRRAGLLARSLEPGPAQAAAMLAIAVSLLDGEPTERALSERFRRVAHEMLGTGRRGGFQQVAEELRAAALARSGDREEALATHVRAIGVLQRLGLYPFELPHQLGVAELLLDTKRIADHRVTAALKRARELVEHLHLTPPSPSVLRLWLLEGRQQARIPDVDGARERFRAIVDRPAASSLPAVRRSALFRLADLELSEGRDSEARAAFNALDDAAFAPERRPTWTSWRATRKRGTVPGDALPPAPGPGPLDRREEGRVQGREDRDGPDDEKDDDNDPLEDGRLDAGSQPAADQGRRRRHADQTEGGGRGDDPDVGLGEHEPDGEPLGRVPHLQEKDRQERGDARGPSDGQLAVALGDPGQVEGVADQEQAAADPQPDDLGPEGGHQDRAGDHRDPRREKERARRPRPDGDRGVLRGETDQGEVRSIDELGASDDREHQDEREHEVHQVHARWGRNLSTCRSQ